MSIPALPLPHLSVSGLTVGTTAASVDRPVDRPVDGSVDGSVDRPVDRPVDTQGVILRSCSHAAISDVVNGTKNETCQCVCVSCF